ncbi:Rab1a [Hexamita inflata]|uniref:Rab1a n=1 Tax=Hexamita inflata TaxID=28002 RepID=A0AA86NH54_9EUKA|nr:Rab1a [Hexamita inflata]CAI9972089.1 Rab1a [Hexamita inflata]
MPDHELKFVMLGESAVGKTSIIHRYISNQFNTMPESTITAYFHTKMIIVDSHSIRLHLWDTAGQERFQSIAPMYYRNADVILVVFAVDSADSLQKAILQIQDVKMSQVQRGQQIILLGNKCDKENQVKGQAEQYSKDFQIPVFWVSAFNGTGISDAVLYAIRKASSSKSSGNHLSGVVDIQAKREKGCCM